MVIGELLKIGMTLIEGKEYTDPILESILVLSRLLDVDKSYVYVHLDDEVGEDIEHRFICIMKKRKEGYPLQYIFKEREFMGLDFYVEEGVLIPRPETELMVEYIIEYIDKNYKDQNIKVLDIGSGSGAISISIGKYCPNTRVYGVDIGDVPIKVSNINRDNYGLSNVSFHKGNIFEPLEKLDIDDEFQIIASNPPYIRSRDIETLQVDVREFEPRLALDGGADGLIFYREISSKGKRYLKHGGMLIYEIGYDQGNDIREILLEQGFSNISILKDFQGHDRVIIGFLDKGAPI